MNITTLIPVLLLLGMGTNLNAQDSIVDTVAKGCEKEIESYCSQVSPGATATGVPLFLKLEGSVLQRTRWIRPFPRSSTSRANAKTTSCRIAPTSRWAKAGSSSACAATRIRFRSPASRL